MHCAEGQPSPLVIVQARTGSRRLPGKALLNFHGRPLAILAAIRAGNRGARVVLATSEKPSDDALAALVLQHGITLVRGPLENVLARFEQALGTEPDDAPVVRLTADNLLPDGDLIAEVVEMFQAKNLDYVSTSDDTSGLPYGCSVEVTRAGHLRRASREARTVHEQEHVTPFIRRRFGNTVFTGHAALGCGHLRATIDCLDDFEALHHATPAGADLEQLSWRTWVEHLQTVETAPRGRRAVSDMVLGTAQLGMAYGIARRASPGETESLDMLRRAIIEGVGYLDTARAYGDSEALIGKLRACGWDGRARIVTKLSPLAGIPDDATPAEVHARVENSLLRSCLALGSERLDCVLLHRSVHLQAWNGTVLETLRKWQEAGQIGTLGVSVQSPDELYAALDYDEIEHVQLPCNILDHRWDAVSDVIRAIRSKRELVVHVRSALLQGLLSTSDPALWRRAHVENAGIVIDWLDGNAAALGRESVVALCLAWARGLDWADGIVVGCDSLEQLHDTVRLFNQPALSQEEIHALAVDRPHLELRSLDPAQWGEAVSLEPAS